MLSHLCPVTLLQLDVEPEVIPPIPDPLGISSVDLRSIQAFYASGTYCASPLMGVC
jgi:hypothetical protein